MATSNIFEKLTYLQGILVNKYELEAQIAEAPKNLGSQEELLSRLKKEYITKNSDYEAIKEKIGQLKLELDEAIKSRENGEKGMDNIQTHREYEALDKQINEATIKENDVRKDLQHEEKNLQALDESLKNYEDMIKAQENDLSAAKQTIDSEIASYKAELEELQRKEDDITPSIDQELLFKFQRIIQRNSEGIVAVKNGVCTGCHMILPAQFANTVREFTETANNSSEDETKILFCPYCSRILKYEESDDEDASENLVSFDLAYLDDVTDEEEDDDDKQEDLFERENRFAGEDDDIDDEDEELDDEDDEDESDEDDDD